MVLPEDMALIFHRNNPVIPTKLLKYFNAREFKNGGDGSQDRMALPAFMTVMAAVLFSAAMIPVAADASRAVPPQPAFQAGSPVITSPYGTDQRVPLQAAPIPGQPDGTSPRQTAIPRPFQRPPLARRPLPPRPSLKPWHFERFEFQLPPENRPATPIR